MISAYFSKFNLDSVQMTEPNTPNTGIDINANETLIYAIAIMNPLLIYAINASDGSLELSYEVSELRINSDQFTIKVNSNDDVVGMAVSTTQ